MFCRKHIINKENLLDQLAKGWFVMYFIKIVNEKQLLQK